MTIFGTVTQKMVNLFLLIFCLSVFFVFYSYILFPLILGILSSGKAFKHSKHQSHDDLPAISVVMAAFNEDKVIEEKIKGILKSNYPSHQLEIVIG